MSKIAILPVPRLKSRIFTAVESGDSDRLDRLNWRRFMFDSQDRVLCPSNYALAHRASQLIMRNLHSQKAL